MVVGPRLAAPTFMRSIEMLGTRWSMTHGSRADGMFCKDSRSNVVFAAVALVSTIGLSPLTVTVSWTVEMASC